MRFGRKKKEPFIVEPSIPFFRFAFLPFRVVFTVISPFRGRGLRSHNILGETKQPDECTCSHRGVLSRSDVCIICRLELRTATVVYTI